MRYASQQHNDHDHYDDDYYYGAPPRTWSFPLGLSEPCEKANQACGNHHTPFLFT
jgi:hypothetical protein